MQSKEKLTRYFGYAVLVHVLIIGWFVIGFSKNKTQARNPIIAKAAPEQRPMIKSALVDKSLVEKAVQRQRQVEVDKKRKIDQEKQELAKLKQQTRQAQAERAKAEQSKAAQKKLLEQQKRQLALEKAKYQQEKARIQEEKRRANQENQKLFEANRRLEREQIENELATKARREAAEKRNRWIEQEVNRYEDMFRQDIENNRTLSTAFANNITTVFRLKLLPDGSILTVELEQSSGNSAYDAMQEKAIYKSAPFEMPKDPELLRRVRDLRLSLSNDLSKLS